MSNPQKPFEVGFFDTEGYTDGIYIRGDYAYLADRKFVRIIDISNPAKPEEIGLLDNMIDAKQIQVLGDYAYVADGHGGLRIIDVSSPRKPKEVGVVDTPGSGYDVCISGNYAYIADGDGGGLRIIDISDPHNPKEISHNIRSIVKIQVIGKYAYIVGMFGSFIIMDISNPLKPEIVKSFYDPPISLRDICIPSNGYIYMAMGDEGFLIMHFEEWDIFSCDDRNNQVITWGKIKQQPN